MPALWAPLAVALWGGGFFFLLHVKTAQNAKSEPPWSLLWGGSLVTVVLWHVDGIAGVLTTTPQDSFYTLSPAHRAGLLFLSVLLLTILFWAANVKSVWISRAHSIRDRSLLFSWAVDTVVTIPFFVLLYGLSIQAYYFYYRLIIPGLPAQSVIRFEHDAEFLLGLFQISSGKSYAELLAALSFWTLLTAVTWRHLALSPRFGSYRAMVVAGLVMGGACFLYRWLITI